MVGYLIGVPQHAFVAPAALIPIGFFFWAGWPCRVAPRSPISLTQTLAALPRLTGLPTLVLRFPRQLFRRRTRIWLSALPIRAVSAAGLAHSTPANLCSQSAMTPTFIIVVATRRSPRSSSERSNEKRPCGLTCIRSARSCLPERLLHEVNLPGTPHDLHLPRRTLARHLGSCKDHVEEFSGT